MMLSVMDSYYDRVNELLRKFIRDDIQLTADEKSELGAIIEIFRNEECDDEVCKSDTCRFTGNPEEWVKYEGHDDLCDLFGHFIKYGKNLDPPKGDALNTKGRILPGHGFGSQ